MIRSLKIYVLRALLACDGLSMPESALIGAVQVLARPVNATRSDVETAIKGLQDERLVMGVGDALMETSWTLTTDGTHRARKL